MLFQDMTLFPNVTFESFPKWDVANLINELIYFNNKITKSNKKISELFQNNLKLHEEILESNEEILKNSKLTKFMNAPSFVPKDRRQKPTNEKSEEIIVTLMGRITIKPDDSIYCQAQVKLNDDLMDKDFIFIPLKAELKYTKLFINSTPWKIKRRILTEFSDDDNNNEHKWCKKIKTFHLYIFMENFSQEAFRLD